MEVAGRHLYNGCYAKSNDRHPDVKRPNGMAATADGVGWHRLAAAPTARARQGKPGKHTIPQ